MSHPEEEQLLRYADGESPAREANRIGEHLKACWECRAAVEEQQATIGECVRYRKSILQVHLPPAPQPWTDIYRGFAEIDAALDQPSFWKRALHAPMRWAPVAVALVLVTVVFYRFRQAPSVQAAELLRKAIAAADGSPEKPRRIQIRTRDRSLTLQAGAQKKLAMNAKYLARRAQLWPGNVRHRAERSCPLSRPRRHRRSPPFWRPRNRTPS